ncbi:hypothetical protein ACS0TY_032719 [Phlomoides rotata]
MNYDTVLFLAFTFFFFFFIQADLLALAQVVKCENKGNYTRDSIYSANLNTMFTSLYTNVYVNNSGFYNVSVGQDIDRANGIMLCVADANFTACRDCVQDGAARLLNSCPNQKQAILWGDACMIRYSNDTIYGKVAKQPNQYWWNPTLAVSPDLFMNYTKALVDDLRKQAASGGPLRKVAARNAIGPALQPISALVQCTPDLSPQDCNSCLTDATEMINETCYHNSGCQILWPSCKIRFETYSFFNETRLRELETTPQPSPPQPFAGKDDEDNTTRIVIAVVVPIVVCLILAVSAIIFLRKKKKQKSIEDPVNQIDAAESVQYAFSTIKAATNDFSDDNKLGQGGFGTVYKGKLPNDQEIAVKRLSRDSQQGDLEFKNEVLLLAKLQHRNLVRLLGFALEGIEKLLVYEFVENASLDLFIFDPINHLYLDWERRYKIIVGIARGILYMHEDSRLRIIHRDLKASNILLDKEMNPKIADFGMARLFGQDETRGTTSRIVGTYGYMPPEYIMHGQFSIKSDVFSFGVLVLEIISGRKNSSLQSNQNVEVLLSYAWKNWRDGTIGNVVDPLLKSNSGSMSEMVRCIHIGLLCVQENAGDRPTMASVVLMLSSFSMTLAVPSAPAFNFPNGNDSDASRFHDYNSRNARAPEFDHSSGQADHQSDHSSQNEVSISELYPR